jgi:hypothetical protein
MEKIRDEELLAYFEALYRHLLVETKENQKVIRIVCVPA